MLENYRCSQSAGLLLIKSDIYLLTSFFNTRILFVWVICPTTELFSCRQHRYTSCQLLLSAPAYGHHAYGDNIGLLHIHVILLEIQRPPVSVWWIPPWWTLVFFTFLFVLCELELRVRHPLDARCKLKEQRTTHLLRQHISRHLTCRKVSDTHIFIYHDFIVHNTSSCV